MGLLDVFVSAGPARTRRAGPFGRLLRPPACLACGAADAWPCCAACLRPEPAGAGPWRLAADPALAFWTLGLYQGPLRAAVLAGKFRGQPAALAALGRHLGSALLAAGVGADLVTWIASRPARGLPRDHARQIAAGIAAALDLPLLGLLTPNAGKDLGRARNALRERPGPPAVDDGADRTLARPAGAAHRPPPRVRRRLAGGRILLVDDVATTGSTLAGAALALHQAGARQVEGVVLASASAAFGSGIPADAGGVPRCLSSCGRVFL